MLHALPRLACRALLWLMAALAASAVQAQTTVEYIHTDALGTPVAVTDASGNVIERSEYTPYGELLNRPLTDGPGYTGHVQDAATGLTYMQQRYYDPGVGRFLSVDPVEADPHSGGLFNRYMYAANNPYAFIDPDGRCTGSRIENGDGTCVSTGDFTTMGGGPTMPGAQTVVHQASIEAQTGFNPQTALAADDEPRIPLAGSMSELIDATYERVVRRTSFVASGGLAAGLGFDLEATKTTRPWQKDKLGANYVAGLGAFLGAHAKFRTFSWGDGHGTTGGKLKVNPLGYFKLKVGAGLSVGLSGSFNDHGGGTLSISVGGGLGAQAIVKPTMAPGWEIEL